MISLLADTTTADVQQTVVQQHWLSDVAWPLVVLVVGLVVILPKTSPARQLARRWNLGTVRVAAFGSEVELTKEAKQANEKAFDSALSEFRAGTFSLYRQSSHELNIEQLFTGYWNKTCEVVSELHAPGPTDVRGAIYVEHALLRDYLIQLSKYRPSGGGDGRAFSTRFGIIGKAWREERSQCLSMNEDVRQKEEILVRDYGFSQPEARAIRKSKEHESFAAIFARSQSGVPLCVIYLDADGDEIFTDELVRKLEEQLASEDHLLQAIESAQRSVRETVPQVRIPDDQHI